MYLVLVIAVNRFGKQFDCIFEFLTLENIGVDSNFVKIKQSASYQQKHFGSKSSHFLN